MRPPKQTGLAGFSLIELMTSVAIVAILASLAVPSYLQHVRRAHREEAKTVLLANAQFLERCYTETNDYSQMLDPSGAPVPVVLPVTQAPADGQAFYSITLQSTPATFLLSAVPLGRMAEDECGTFTFNELGVRGANPTGSLSVTDCWAK